MANEKNAISVDMDALLDGTLDDLADMPEFKPFPAGAHKCIIQIVGPKKIGEHPAFEILLKGQETIELANADDVPLSKDQETNVAYMMDNELGQGKFKAILAKLAEHFKTTTNRETIAAAQNAEVIVITGVRSNKEKTKSYTDIVEVSFE